MMSENILNSSPSGNKRKRALSEVSSFNVDDISAGAAKRAKSTEPETVVGLPPMRKMTRNTKDIAVAALKKSFKGFASMIESKMSQNPKDIDATPSTTSSKTGFATFAVPTTSSPFGTLPSTRGTSFLGLSGRISAFGSPTSTFGSSPSSFSTPRSKFGSPASSFGSPSPTFGGTSFCGLRSTSDLGATRGSPSAAPEPRGQATMFIPGYSEALKKRQEDLAELKRIEEERFANSPGEKLRRALLAESKAKEALERHNKKLQRKEPGVNRQKRADREKMKKILEDTYELKKEEVALLRLGIESAKGYVNYFKDGEEKQRKALAKIEEAERKEEAEGKKKTRGKDKAEGKGDAEREDKSGGKEGIEYKEEEAESPKTEGHCGSTSSPSPTATPKRKRQDEETEANKQPAKKPRHTENIDASTSEPLPISNSSALAVQNPKMAALAKHLAPFYTDEAEAEDERWIEEQKQANSLINYLHTGYVNTRAGFSSTIERHRANEDVDYDARDFDADYEDFDGDYGDDSDDQGDADESYRSRAEVDEDPTYDPEFVAEEHSTSEGKIKLPSYAPKMPQQEEAKPQQNSAQRRAFNAQADATISPNATNEYIAWKKQADEFFSKGKSTPFPVIRTRDCALEGNNCTGADKATKLKICRHDVERVLKGSAMQTEGREWVDRLKREAHRWHPDRYSGVNGQKWVEEAREMFQIIRGMSTAEEARL